MQPDRTQEPSLGFDDRVFADVIQNGDAPQRTRLAAQIAAFLCHEDAPKLERDQLVPTALKLAADAEADVRQALAQGLAACADLHADLLFAIISDDDEIALPFLCRTPALNHWHMLAVLRVGDDVRRAAIALRPDISVEAVGYIVDSLSLALNALLFENESVTFTDEQYRRLYARFGEAREMLDRLFARDDLPPDIRILHARQSALRMQKLIVERGWIPANDAVELVADAEENAVLNILGDAGPAQREAVVTFLLDHEMLTSSIIVRAACLGGTDVVAHILAQLAGVSVKRAKDMMFGRSQGGFRSLHAKSGLPQSCYWTLQAACDTAREERDEGIRLTPDDFGRRLIEILMTRYEALPMKERPGHLDFVGRFASDRTRLIARRLKADLLNAA